jgi:hypothetical protein
MQLDIFVPEHRLAFEYQGEQHYSDVFALGPRWKYCERDADKKLACQQKGITLISVPYWWDNRKDSLLATIQTFRPDIITPIHNISPIPNQPPQLWHFG